MLKEEFLTQEERLEVVCIPAVYNAVTNIIDFETEVFGVFALVYNVYNQHTA